MTISSRSCNINMLLILILMFQTFVSLLATNLHQPADQNWQTANLPANCMQVTNFADKAGIATVIINCLGKHVTDLAAQMTLLAAGSQHSTVFHTCASSFVSAKQELKTAAMNVMGHNYSGVDQSLSNVLVCNFQCKSAITKGKFAILPLTSSVIDYKLKMVDQLCQAAKTAIHRQ